MKNNFLFIFSFLLIQSSYAQIQDIAMPPAIDSADKVFSMVEVEAEFPGGLKAWKTYLIKNLKADVPVNYNAPSGQYRVIVRFIVSKDGKISEVAVEKDPGYGTAQEAVRVIKNGPNWIPAMQNGKKVNAYHRQPITFVVSK